MEPKKTTTLRMILVIAGRNSGKLEYFGMDFDRHARQIKDRIGVVLDGDCFYEDLSLLEMKSVFVPAYTQWCEEDFRSYMEQFDLDSKQQIKTLSKGMKSKYALAFVLSHKAELLIIIDRGQIVFQEEKDSLLERYRIVKGGVSKLDSDKRPLFMQMKTSLFGFTGLTEKISEVKRSMPDAVIERATLLSISPYSRALLVVSMYVVCAIVFAVNCGVRI